MYSNNAKTLYITLSPIRLLRNYATTKRRKRRCNQPGPTTTKPRTGGIYIIAKKYTPSAPHGDKYEDSTFITPRKKLGGKQGVDRIDVIDAFDKAGKHRESQRLKDCGNKYYPYICHDCNTFVAKGSKCESRFCPECGDERIKEYLYKNEDFFNALPVDEKGKRRLSLITLTMENVPDEMMTKEFFDHFMKVATEYFGDKELRQYIYGGTWAPEVKRPKEGSTYYDKRKKKWVKVQKGRLWNLHLHGLIDHELIPFGLYNSIWTKLTLKQFPFYGKYVDLKNVKGNIKNAFKEVIKYIYQPPNLGDANSYVKWAKIIKNKQLLRSFGSMHKKGSRFVLPKRSSKLDVYEVAWGDMSIDEMLDPNNRRIMQAKLTEAIEKSATKCPNCDSIMEYLGFYIGRKEALRWLQYIHGPKLDPDYNFFYIDMGVPETLPLIEEMLGGEKVRQYSCDKIYGR